METLVDLEDLKIVCRKVDADVFMPIGCCTKLKNLEIEARQVINTAFLRKLTCLENLIIKCTDFDFLTIAGCTKLKTLDFSLEYSGPDEKRDIKLSDFSKMLLLEELII